MSGPVEWRNVRPAERITFGQGRTYEEGPTEAPWVQYGDGPRVPLDGGADAYWCPTCDEWFAPEWRPLAGYQMATHRFGDLIYHGLHRAEVNADPRGGTCTTTREVVIRENGQHKDRER